MEWRLLAGDYGRLGFRQFTKQFSKVYIKAVGENHIAFFVLPTQFVTWISNLGRNSHESLLKSFTFNFILETISFQIFAL
jgi:hypothetical protein